MSNTLTLYPLANYTFGTKEAQPEEDPSVAARLDRLQIDYARYGMRRTVEAVMVVHEHNHPHVLMLQIANAFFKLPGDYIRPGEDESDGMKNRLSHKLSPGINSVPPIEAAATSDWEVGDCLSVWWRPNFETFMVSSPGGVKRAEERLCEVMRAEVRLGERSELEKNPSVASSFNVPE